MRILLPRNGDCCILEAKVVDALPQADILMSVKGDARCRVFTIDAQYALQAVWGQARQTVKSIPDGDWFLTDDGRVYAKLLSRRYKNDDSSKGPKWLHRAENLWPEMRPKLQPVIGYMKHFAPVFAEGFEKYFLSR